MLNDIIILVISIAIGIWTLKKAEEKKKSWKWLLCAATYTVFFGVASSKITSLSDWIMQFLMNSKIVKDIIEWKNSLFFWIKHPIYSMEVGIWELLGAINPELQRYVLEWAIFIWDKHCRFTIWVGVVLFGLYIFEYLNNKSYMIQSHTGLILKKIILDEDTETDRNVLQLYFWQNVGVVNIIVYNAIIISTLIYKHLLCDDHTVICIIVIMLCVALYAFAICLIRRECNVKLALSNKTKNTFFRIKSIVLFLLIFTGLVYTYYRK